MLVADVQLPTSGQIYNILKLCNFFFIQDPKIFITDGRAYGGTV